MSLMGIAASCQITTSALQSLLNGTVTVGAAARLETTSSSLQTFVNGGTSIGLASQLGTTSSNLQELRSALGQQGAIGMIIGMMAAKP